MGARVRSAAPPGRAGRARRKLGREFGGGAATLSHAGLTRPPLPGAEVTAGLGEAVVAARCAKGPPGGGELVRGRARPGGEPGSLSGDGGRKGPAPRGTRRAARPAPPLPRHGRCPGREPPRGSRAPGPRRSSPVQVSRAQGGAGELEAGGPAVRGMQTWAFLLPPPHFFSHLRLLQVLHSTYSRVTMIHSHYLFPVCFHTTRIPTACGQGLVCFVHSCIPSTKTRYRCSMTIC